MSLTVIILTFGLTIKGRTYDLIESSLDRDKFMSPEEALEFGLIDKILEHPPKLGHDENKKEEPAK
jgi:ATP-dependent protease ClpP protease subunit